MYTLCISVIDVFKPSSLNACEVGQFDITASSSKDVLPPKVNLYFPQSKKDVEVDEAETKSVAAPPLVELAGVIQEPVSLSTNTSATNATSNTSSSASSNFADCVLIWDSSLGCLRLELLSWGIRNIKPIDHMSDPTAIKIPKTPAGRAAAQKAAALRKKRKVIDPLPQRKKTKVEEAINTPSEQSQTCQL